MRNNEPGGDRHQQVPWRLSRTALAGIALLLAAGLVTACGGAPTSSTAAHGQSKRGTELAYSRYIRAHGVPGFPDPLPGGGYSRSAIQAIGGRSSPRLQAAQRHCLPQAAAAGITHTAAQIRQHVEQLLAFAACMRRHGVPKFPDPSPRGGFVTSASSTADPSSPQFQAAQKACAYFNP